jgi:hypothetical protein
MRLGFILPVLATASLGLLTAPRDAQACGACLVPPGENTTVTAHRMALSISPEQTVLWDQIQYDGDAEEFAWVLPVKPGAYVQISTDAWFEALDAATTATAFAPSVDCGGGVNGPGCGSSNDSLRAATALGDEESGGTGGQPGSNVTVVHRGTVGPFDTVTLSTETPGVLNDWLNGAGYAVDPETQPVIDAYVAEGFDFIALRLQPGKDVKAMKPVRVVSPGASPTLPLRMVAIGTGANVALTLFVISEGRWQAKNFSNAVLPADLLSWDFQTQSSNYGEMREKILTQNAGKTWLTSFAFQGALLGQLEASLFMGGIRTYGQNFADRIATAYVQQGLTNGEAEVGDCTAAFANAAPSTMMVANPCPMGAPLNDPSCGSVSAGQIDARTLACGALDDVAVSLVGLHPADVWLTRLEANLPRAALAEDLLVEPAGNQQSVDNMMQAVNGTHTELACPGSAVVPAFGGRKSGPFDRGPLVMALGMGLFALAALGRRLFGVARA